jgi:hypothetical protein
MLPRMRWARAVPCLLLVVVALSSSLPARAQDGGADLQFLGQPVWHGADDQLNIRLLVTNTSDAPLKGFNIVVGSSSRVTTRSGLRTIFDPDAFEPVSSLPLPLGFPKFELNPDNSREIVVKNPVSDLALIASGEPGVYPVKVTLLDPSGASLDSIATQILFYPERPETRLGIVPLVALNDSPARAPDGNYGPNEDGIYPLEDALSEGGWLSATADALMQSTGRGLHAGFAPTPRLLEELADVSDGYVRVVGDRTEQVGASAPVPRAAHDALTALQNAIRTGALQPVKVPYSAPDLPTIAPVASAVTNQLAVGSAALSEVLGDDAAGAGRAWAYAPSGRLDAEALEQISGAGVEHTFFASSSLQEPANPEAAGCPVPAFSFACPVEVATELGGSLSGYSFDPRVQEHLSGVRRSPSSPTALQRFFAETAMLREELPGTSGRVIAAALPLSSEMAPSMINKLVLGITRAPWLESMTPGEGLKASTQPVRKAIVDSSPPLPYAPSESYLATTEEAADTVAEFGSMRPPAALIRRLGRNVLVAQGRALWTDLSEGIGYATASVDEVEHELQKIQVIGPNQITLTSKKGEFQFIVVNNADYDVTVDVAMTSEKLELPQTRLLKVSPGQQQVTIQVTTEASGIFPLTVQLKTPDGLDINEAKPIIVRSTEFNEIALGITFGALGFVIVFYVVRGIRRRRNRGEPRPGTLAA